MVALCLIGVTPEVEVRPFAIGDMNPPLADWASLVADLRPQPGDTLYQISRHRFDQGVWTLIGAYRHAYQKGGDRPGGFIGAAVICLNQVARGGPLVAFLDDTLDQLSDMILVKGEFRRKLSDVEFERWPSSLIPLESSLSKFYVNAGLRPDKKDYIYIDLSSDQEKHLVPWYLEWAQIGNEFSDIGRVFVGNSVSLSVTADKSFIYDRYSSMDFLIGRSRTDGSVVPAQPSPSPSPKGTPPDRRSAFDVQSNSDEGTLNRPDLYISELSRDHAKKLRRQAQLTPYSPEGDARNWLASDLRNISFFRGAVFGILAGVALVLTVSVVQVALFSLPAHYTRATNNSAQDNIGMEGSRTTSKPELRPSQPVGSEQKPPDAQATDPKSVETQPIDQKKPDPSLEEPKSQEGKPPVVRSNTGKRRNEGR